MFGHTSEGELEQLAPTRTDQQATADQRALQRQLDQLRVAIREVEGYSHLSWGQATEHEQYLLRQLAAAFKQQLAIACRRALEGDQGTRRFARHLAVQQVQTRLAEARQGEQLAARKLALAQLADGAGALQDAADVLSLLLEACRLARQCTRLWEATLWELGGEEALLPAAGGEEPAALLYMATAPAQLALLPSAAADGGEVAARLRAATAAAHLDVMPAAAMEGGGQLPPAAAQGGEQGGEQRLPAAAQGSEQGGEQLLPAAAQGSEQGGEQLLPAAAQGSEQGGEQLPAALDSGCGGKPQVLRLEGRNGRDTGGGSGGSWGRDTGGADCLPNSLRDTSKPDGHSDSSRDTSGSQGGSDDCDASRSQQADGSASASGRAAGQGDTSRCQQAGSASASASGQAAGQVDGSGAQQGDGSAAGTAQVAGDGDTAILIGASLGDEGWVSVDGGATLLRIIRVLGSGGQGSVHLAECLAVLPPRQLPPGCRLPRPGQLLAVKLRSDEQDQPSLEEKLSLAMGALRESRLMTTVRASKPPGCRGRVANLWLMGLGSGALFYLPKGTHLNLDLEALRQQGGPAPAGGAWRPCASRGDLEALRQQYTAGSFQQLLASGGQSAILMPATDHGDGHSL